jgi:hypothetical protein
VKLNPQLRHRKVTVTTVSQEMMEEHYTAMATAAVFGATP